MRILLVEDNNADARLVEEILKDSGIEHELIWINDGKKALDRIHSDDDFDLFILDLNIPQASGLSVVSAIRRKEKFRTTPVIIMTGLRPSDMTMIEEDGSLHYLVKPMTIEEIDRTTVAIKDILQGKKI